MRNGILLGMLLMAAVPVYGAMDNVGAWQRARNRWGPQGAVWLAWTGPNGDSVPRVGFASPQCATEFTAVGRAADTWENAFADADAHPPKIAGPFKSTVTIKETAWDNVAVARVQFFVDGSLAGTVSPSVPTASAAVTIDLNTASLAAGLHVLCVQATDTSGNVGRSAYGLLFRVDPYAGTNFGFGPGIVTTWDLKGSWIFR